MPVEQGKPAGTAVFDPRAIAERNRSLEQLAKKHGALFLAPLPALQTYDGVVGRWGGLLAAIECVTDKAARRFFAPQGKVGGAVAAACLERGVIGRAMPHGDILGYAPPLTLSRAEADRIVSATKGAIEAVYETLGGGSA